jgi:chromosome segregation ATPase
MEIQRTCQNKLTMLDDLCAEVERTKREVILREQLHLREVEKYTSVVEELKTEIVSREELFASNIKEFEAKQSEWQKEIEKLHSRIKELEDDQSLLVNDMTELKVLTRDLQDQRTDAEAEIDSLKSHLSSQKAHFEEEMTGLFEKFAQVFPMQTTARTLEEALADAATIIAGYHEGNEDLQLRCTEYEHRISCLDAEIATVTCFVSF